MHFTYPNEKWTEKCKYQTSYSWILVFKVQLWISNQWTQISKQGLLQESRVSRCLLSHSQLQSYSFGCPSALCLFLSAVVYCLGSTCAPLNTQEAMFSHFPVNMQSFFGACLIRARALTHYSPANDLISCFTYGKPPSDMHLHNISCIPIVGKAVFMNKITFYELTIHSEQSLSFGLNWLEQSQFSFPCLLGAI